jgi:hypothetical protein
MFGATCFGYEAAHNSMNHLRSVKNSEYPQKESETTKIEIKTIVIPNVQFELGNPEKAHERVEQDVEDGPVQREIPGCKVVVVDAQPFHGRDYSSDLGEQM